METLNTRCCIAGGGPAGMMLGYLLARAGVDVVVLEKHTDFLRDFRGDTIHPSTLQVMQELGLLDAFLSRPHDKAHRVRVSISGTDAVVADFSGLRTACKYIAMMPQWEFLDFLRDHASIWPNFRLLLGAEAVDVVEDGGRIRGVRVQAEGGPLTVMADLVVGADGRRSRLREAARLTVRNLGAPIDVLWMRLPVMPGDPVESGGHVNTGHFLAMIYRGDYWQCAYVIPKGGIEAVQARGLDAFRAEIASVAPWLAARTQAIRGWDDVKLLSVTVDRLERWWKPGLLCIGDAAHAMSPIGGVGINLAIQDAVAAANILAAPLADAGVTPEQLTPLLAQVERRRLFPTRVTQAAQLAIQNRFLTPVLDGERRDRIDAPWPVRMLNRWPALRVVPAYAVGIGVRPEHVRSPGFN
ncbi:MAG TPA: FAD-dependent oxidoreductase [Noviherbaspirillum sp.]|jgi:2-polyprenyl-6-methoxyphenol hydroxylase-like FAD-dependent oxidoreductase|uniref:FAD-dependent oxidoreductase n=1 Tax=Noviherbaspirillum sp. TaxID=1926288 RepID=UPI002DDCD0AE|nr:FAD-dependent oxidoreductase [Noviherbaspirillum sp.]HEV2612894.1 FAD-dependent oxidoreductase [Noviherbaspirillum sp.]